MPSCALWQLFTGKPAAAGLPWSGLQIVDLVPSCCWWMLCCDFSPCAVVIGIWKEHRPNPFAQPGPDFMAMNKKAALR